MFRWGLTITLVGTFLAACAVTPRENCYALRAQREEFKAAGHAAEAADTHFAFRKCQASQGDKPSLMWLSDQFASDNSRVHKDEELAFDFMLKAASDDPVSTPVYVPAMGKDPAYVMDVKESGAKKGLVEAQYRVGLMYASGQGTKKDAAKARDWMERAAGAGHSGAIAWLEATPF
jgi:TPR repeat protein